MSAKPRSALGRMMLMFSETVDDLTVIGPARNQLRARLGPLRAAAAGLPFTGLQAALTAELSAAESEEQTLDALPDTAARQAALARIGSNVDATAAKLAQAQARLADHTQLVEQLAAAKAATATLLDAAAQEALGKKLAAVERGLALATGSAATKELAALPTLANVAKALNAEAAAALLPQHVAAAQSKIAAELPALLLRSQAASALDTSSPDMAALAVKLNLAQSAMPAPVTAANALDAERLMGLLGAAVGNAEAQAAREQKAYGDALIGARGELAKLVAPVISADAALIGSGVIGAAETRAAAGDRHGALALLRTVLAACQRVAALALAYTQALTAAKAALVAAQAKMLPGDAKYVEVMLIGAAELKAGAGKRQDALDLLAKVKPHCATAAAANLQSRYSSDFAADLPKLLAHPQQAAFAAEIAAMNRRLESVKALVAAGASKGADKDMNLLHWDAKKLLAQADLHAAYAAARDPVKQRVDQLKTAAPVASNSAITAELAALDALLDKAEKQAGKRLYDAAQALLVQAGTDHAAAAALKRDHAAYAQELLRVEPLVGAVLGVAGTPAEADAAAVRAKLLQAKALADPGRDFVAALALLQRTGTQCDACTAMNAASGKDASARDDALTSLDSDTAGALAAVRKLFGDLKARPGQAGLVAELAEIERLLTEADAALAA